MLENATTADKTVKIADFCLDMEVGALLEDRYEASARIWVGNMLAAGQVPIAVFATEAAAEACHRKSLLPERPGCMRVKLTRMNGMYWAWEVIDL